MNILITGINGFVGSNLVKGFKNKYHIYGLDILDHAKEGILKIFSWEDMNAGNLHDVDAIIHLAGISKDTKDTSQIDEYFKINTDLTKRVFNYFSEHKNIKKFIFFSSVKAVVDKIPGGVLKEDAIPNPVTPYGQSKIKAEKYILNKIITNTEDYRDRDIIILRPSMIHGPGHTGNIRLLYNYVKKGLPWPLGAFHNKRSFTSLDNLIYVIEQILTAPIPSGVYNIADDEVLSTNEIIKVISAATSGKTNIWNIPSYLIKICICLGDLFHLPLNSFLLDKLRENYCVSNEKIKTALQIEKLPVSAREGLYRTILSFNSDLNKN